MKTIFFYLIRQSQRKMPLEEDKKKSVYGFTLVALNNLPSTNVKLIQINFDLLKPH